MSFLISSLLILLAPLGLKADEGHEEFSNLLTLRKIHSEFGLQRYFQVNGEHCSMRIIGINNLPSAYPDTESNSPISTLQIKGKEVKRFLTSSSVIFWLDRPKYIPEKSSPEDDLFHFESVARKEDDSFLCRDSRFIRRCRNRVYKTKFTIDSQGEILKLETFQAVEAEKMKFRLMQQCPEASN